MVRNRFKYKDSIKALPFRNRFEDIDTITGQIIKYLECPDYQQVIQVNGLGGMGKTRLVQQAFSIASSNYPKIHFFRTSLEAERVSDIWSVLLSIRDQLPFNCLLFDFAVSLYWSAIGQPFQLNIDGIPKFSSIAEIIESAGGVMGLPVPINLLRKTLNKIKRLIDKNRLYSNDSFDEIYECRYEPHELRDRLPSYLGADIAKRLQNLEDRFVFFYDSYEKQSLTSLKAKAQWLQDLISSASYGIHIIASRERIAWESEGWADCLTNIEVNWLPRSECIVLFEEAYGKLDWETINLLLEITNCIPFYVQLVCAISSDDRSVQSDIKFYVESNTKQQVVERFLNHFSREVLFLIISLSIVQFFDTALFNFFLREFQIPFVVLHFREMTDMFFVESVRPQLGLYKTHDLLTDHVEKHHLYQNVSQTAIRAALSHLRIQLHTNSNSTTCLFKYVGILNSLRYTKQIEPSISADIFECGYRLYDIGQWDSMANELSRIDHQFRGVGYFVAAFFHALSIRKTQNIKNGLIALNSLADDWPDFGSYTPCLEMEKAYLLEISGNYDDAANIFSHLKNSLGEFDPTSLMHIRLRLYYADILAMQGSYIQSDNLLIEVSDQLLQENVSCWMDFIRLRGHNFKFSYIFDKAFLLYEQALAVSEIGHAIHAKLQTNITETLCWLNPGAAINVGRDAIEENLNHRNKLEVSKCHTALAIANASMRNFEQALNELTLSVKEAKEIQYPAGVLFSHFAGAIVGYISGEKKLMSDYALKSIKLIHRIGAYYTLLLPLSIMLNEKEYDLINFKEIEWIEPQNINDRFAYYLKNIASGT